MRQAGDTYQVSSHRRKPSECERFRAARDSFENERKGKGRPLGSLNKRRLGCVNANCRPKNICRKCTGEETAICKPKNQKTRPKRTGGIYLSVDGGAASSRILELREILAAEKNIVKESILMSLKRKYPSLDLWVHDSVCAGKFSEGIVGRRLLGRFHMRIHKSEICRTKFNPDTHTVELHTEVKIRIYEYSFLRTNIPKAQPAFSRASNGGSIARGILGTLSPSLQRVRFWPQ